MNGCDIMKELFNISYNKRFPFIHITKDSLYSILFECIFIGVFGFIMETILEYIFTKQLIDRGVLCGPFIPIYALFCLILCLVNKFPEKNIKSILYTMFVIFVFSLVFEELGGRICEAVIHARLWRYKFILTSPSGYTNLFICLLWAIFGTLYLAVGIPLIKKLSDKISNRIKLAIIIEVAILLVIDYSYTIYRNTVSEYKILYSIKHEPALVLFLIGIFIYLGLVSYILYYISKQFVKLNKKLDFICFIISSFILLIPFFSAYEYLFRSGKAVMNVLASIGFIDAAFLIYLALAVLISGIILLIYKLVVERIRNVNNKLYFYKHRLFLPIYFIFNIIVSLVVILFGIISLKNPTTTTISVGSGSKNLKIVAVSDIHYQTIGGIINLDDLVNDLNQKDADLILFLGDTVDNYVSESSLGKKRVNYIDYKEFGNYMMQIKSTYGIYDISGNHEFEKNSVLDINFFFNRVEEIAPNYHYLDDEAITIDGILNLVGRRDYLVGGKSGTRKTINQIVSEAILDTNLDLIVLDHQPQDYLDSFNSGAILQLSGHTHNGQIFPGDIIVSLYHSIRYNCISYGLYQKNDFSLFVSRGYGAWGFPLRTTGNAEIVEILYYYS